MIYDNEIVDLYVAFGNVSDMSWRLVLLF